MTGLFILIIAVALDVLLGELPDRLHPVAWLGKFIDVQLKLTPAGGRLSQFACGAWTVVFTTCLIILPLYFLLALIQSWNIVVYILLAAWLLKQTFSLRGLWQAVEKVKQCIKDDNITTARSQIKALVSRRSDDLSRSQLISAAIESCSENLCDSVIAPLLFYAIFGLPGAMAYRIVNTFDAMIGYHGRWEYTGKFAARLDDVLNYLPARLSALLIVFSSHLCKASAGLAWAGMLRENGKTESPNAGWPMGAMAGSLGITLEKADAYRLDGGAGELTVESIGRSQAIMLVAASGWIILNIILQVVYGFAG